ncbi:MAG: aspartate kinase, partial [Acidobacteriota bacterium]
MATQHANDQPIAVVKLGSSILVDDSSLRAAVHELYRYIRNGERVIAVASAQMGTTDTLLGRADAVAKKPPRSCVASLASTGEWISAALLTVAADDAGIDAALVDPFHLGLRVKGDPFEAEPVDLDARHLKNLLDRHPLVVVPGFVGVGEGDSICLLGRGGSDLTAIYLAAKLGARCLVVKDVDGWFTDDPRTEPNAKHYRTLSWEDAVAHPAPVMQDRAVIMAQKLGLPFELRAIGSKGGTHVGELDTYLDSIHRRPPLDVVVLGCGTVGTGVVRHLLDHPDRYCLRSILVGNASRERESFVPTPLITDDPDRALAEPADLVIEVMGGLEPAAGLIERGLRKGASVVTANKELIADRGDHFSALAQAHGGEIRESAAVGGAVPMLETVRRIATRRDIHGLRGVVNGTCNYVLDRIAAGIPFADAVAEAQEAGFAEADPTADLSGADAARKLLLLARAAGVTDASLDD